MSEDKKESWTDDLKELIDGGWIMLFIFGTTACLIGSMSLVMIAFTPEKDAIKLALYKDLVIACFAFLTGMFSTMWNNKHYQGSTKNGKEVVSVSSIPSDTEGQLKIQEVTIKKDEPKGDGDVGAK